ncbi:hypothetical protein [Nesterenkonia flava]|uniref:Cell division protein FtsL n=1 Tax=Nesterenkonia flava TaxID=469799 RepID=A0ABU1FV40_9MICC|nr:hypothetical protein [Nesterenkonia flava]MDR5712534.1 hypothetical protein [Nesterenkonia flava]
MSVAPLAHPRADSRAGSAPAVAPKTQKRPALKALPKITPRQRGLFAGIIALLALALAAVLAINIYVANSQYTVVQMQNEHQSLVHENQALTEQVQYLQSPQSLSDAAVSLGMVMPAAAGTLDLETGAVAGSAEAADSSDRPSNFVAAPGSAGRDYAVPVDVSRQAAKAPGGIFGPGALNTLADSGSGHNGSGSDSRSEPSARELNGGSIPAPGLE